MTEPRQDSSKEVKLLINEYWWARHLLATGPNVLDLPEDFLEELVDDVEVQLREHGVDIYALRKELRAAGVNYMDNSTAPYQELREEVNLDEKLVMLFDDTDSGLLDAVAEEPIGGDGSAEGEIYFPDSRRQGLGEDALELIDTWELIFDEMVSDPNEDIIRHEIRIEGMRLIEMRLEEEYDFCLDVTPRLNLCKDLGLMD